MNSRRTILIPSICYCLLWAMFLPRYVHAINPDAISYLQIAKRYANGEIATAINGYWSPLISWLLVPFIAIGMNGIVAFKIANGLIGLATLGQCHRMLRRINMTVAYPFVGLLALAVLLAYFALAFNTSDLLQTLLLLVFLHHYGLADDCWKRGLLVGVVGSLAFLSKGYSLPLIVMFIACDVMLRIVGRRRIPKSFVGATLVSLCCGCLVWASVISWKYGSFTLGTVSAYNQKLSHCDGYIGDRHPFVRGGFFEPPYSDSVSIWEDISDVTSEWEPGGSVPSWERYFARVYGNTTDTILQLTQLNLLAVPIFAFAMIWILRRTRTDWLHHPITQWSVMLAIFPLGYVAFFFVHERYLMTMFVLSVMIGTFGLSHILTRIAAGSQLGQIIRVVFAAGVAGSAMFRMLQEPYSYASIARYARSVEFSPNSRLASAGQSGAEWCESLELAYDRDCVYVGQTGSAYSDEESLHHALRRHRVKYFVLRSDRYAYGFLSQYPEITQSKINGLEIYQLIE